MADSLGTLDGIRSIRWCAEIRYVAVVAAETEGGRMNEGKRRNADVACGKGMRSRGDRHVCAKLCMSEETKYQMISELNDVFAERWRCG